VNSFCRPPAQHLIITRTQFINMTIKSEAPLEPTFPLPFAPPCPDPSCRRPGTLIPAARRTNEVGNAGRPYYVCVHGNHPRRFITFDDDLGIYTINPRCDCGFTSRITNRSNQDGQFYCCPIGRCGHLGSAPPMPGEPMDLD